LRACDADCGRKKVAGTLMFALFRVWALGVRVFGTFMFAFMFGMVLIT
jgi:hypothetical protein